MGKNKVCFSVGEYDSDGDKTEHGIYLHFGETRIRVAESLDEFKEFVDLIKIMTKEITENYMNA